jgi:hypothetical protein
MLGACRQTAPSVTYHANIAPILDQQCASCHRPITGDPNDPVCVAGAPFSLLDYKTVKSHANEIAEATATRAMPPWLPEPGPHRFANERRLSDAQIALIQQWVDQGRTRRARRPPRPHCRPGPTDGNSALPIWS